MKESKTTDSVFSSGRKRRSTTVVKNFAKLNVGEDDDDDEEEGVSGTDCLDGGDDGEAADVDAATNKKLDKTKWTQEEVRRNEKKNNDM